MSDIVYRLKVLVDEVEAIGLARDSIAIERDELLARALKAEAACASKDAALKMAQRNLDMRHAEYVDAERAVKAALSPDAGKDWVPRADLDAMTERLESLKRTIHAGDLVPRADMAAAFAAQERLLTEAQDELQEERAAYKQAHADAMTFKAERDALVAKCEQLERGLNEARYQMTAADGDCALAIAAIDAALSDSPPPAGEKIWVDGTDILQGAHDADIGVIGVTIEECKRRISEAKKLAAKRVAALIERPMDDAEREWNNNETRKEAAALGMVTAEECERRVREAYESDEHDAALALATPLLKEEK